MSRKTTKSIVEKGKRIPKNKIGKKTKGPTQLSTREQNLNANNNEYYSCVKLRRKIGKEINRNNLNSYDHL